MSEEQLKALLEKVKGDISLQEKLNAAADVHAVVAIAKEAGFSISADDLTKAQSELSDQELQLSDQELESVAGGGAACWARWSIPWPDTETSRDLFGCKPEKPPWIR